MSKYLTTSIAALKEREQLNGEQRKLVEALESQIKFLRVAENDAISAINKDFAAGRITKAQCIRERADVNAETTEKVEKLTSEIRKIIPSWTESSARMVKSVLDTSERISIKGAEVTGKGVGTILKSPLKVIKKFHESVKEAIQ